MAETGNALTVVMSGRWMLTILLMMMKKSIRGTTEIDVVHMTGVVLLSQTAEQSDVIGAVDLELAINT
ncbi:hypothetical protein [Nostoc sp.]|uniref:hypothetical protein n=1 Tax=Nostoc sp. TaxID=1180 RepID=UPI002FFA884B